MKITKKSVSIQNYYKEKKKYRNKSHKFWQIKSIPDTRKKCCPKAELRLNYKILNCSGFCDILPRHSIWDWNPHTPSCWNVGGWVLLWIFPLAKENSFIQGLTLSPGSTCIRWQGPCLKEEQCWRAIPTSELFMVWAEIFVVTGHGQ